jgi:hypothetical protein
MHVFLEHRRNKFSTLAFILLSKQVSNERQSELRARKAFKPSLKLL